jgi:PAS domain S-box-containing protein
MPQDRALLLMSMALQSAVSLTFGLAFLGWWKGLHRPMAMTWGIAWIAYAVGVAFPTVMVALGFSGTFSPLGRALLSLPLQLSLVLFCVGTGSASGQGTLKATRYLGAAIVILAVFAVCCELEASALGAAQTMVGPYVLPRTVMGFTYAWAAWPLRSVAGRRWGAYELMAAALVGLSLRMFGSVGYEVAQLARGGDHPENLLLTIAQVCLLVMFGIATTLVLVEAERVEADRATNTIRQTADALRASETRFRFVVEHTSDVQVIVGADHRIRYVAPSCERVIGLTPAAFEGRMLLDLIHPEDRDKAKDALARMYADPSGSRPPTAVRIQHRSGQWLPVDVSGRVVPQGDDGATAVLSIRDMTAQRQLEAALLQTGKMDSLGRMAGNIAHDFNNTLTAIIGGLDLALVKLPPDSPARRHLDIMETAARRGAAFTRHLLGFARQLPTTSARFDVRERLAGLEGLVGMAVGRAIQVRFVAGAQPALVRGDADQFDQVIMNLAVNARDSMPSGGHLTIRAWVATGYDVRHSDVSPVSPPYVRVAVEDTGAGIPAAIIDRIFEPFFTTKADGRGTGLGLASAYGFARQSGGRLSVESAEGAGARFFLDLPLDVAALPS